MKFEMYGTVSNVVVVIDPVTGRTRGFAFVTMESQDEAQRAIDGLNGTAHDGRTLVVNFAKNSGGNKPGGRA